MLLMPNIRASAAVSATAIPCLQLPKRLADDVGVDIEIQDAGVVGIAVMREDGEIHVEVERETKVASVMGTQCAALGADFDNGHNGGVVTAMAAGGAVNLPGRPTPLRRLDVSAL
ncbi:hypothetical protein PG996_016166 [Apiospora saccharicola]|uniref:Uncharacterized protein n=1 Tax=Apiospora saccharicola TaxID=335842 RepID=A0ABR1TNE6_9PEZI